MTSSTTPPTSWHLLRHAGTVAVFNLGLWLLQMLSGSQRWDDWDNNLVYTCAIGFSIWGLIELGRIPLLDDAHRGRGWPDLPRSVLLVVGATLGGWLIGTFIGDAYCGCHEMSLLSDQPGKMRSTVIFTLGASAVATWFFYTRGKDAHQSEKIAQAERDATVAKLALLQSQLEPHMLFNTLANLRVLIALDPPRAQAMLDRLIGFLRATLTASRAQSHALSAEFERLDDYLQLMAIRMGPRLQPRFDLPDDLRQTPVPPLLLQPLVENSIAHGLEPKVAGGMVEVSAARDGAQLVLAVRDTGVGLDAAPASTGTQFGLKQVRERLHTLYGDKASLTLEPTVDGTLATIRLPWTGG